MKSIIAFGFAAALATSALAGDCGKCCDAKKAGHEAEHAKAATCPVSRAKQQAKASAGSIKEHAKASKAALKIGSY